MDIDKTVDNLIREDDPGKMLALANTFAEETKRNFEDQQAVSIGREMLRAFQNGDTDALFCAATSWSLEDLLKKAKVIPDLDHLFG